jgi:oligopeptidase B
MLKYSPYDNIDSTPENIEKQYPAIMVTGGMNDPRVSFHEPTKYVAKLRSYYEKNKRGKGADVVLLKMNMDEGHGGKTGRFDRLRDTAFGYAFIVDHLITKRR